MPFAKTRPDYQTGMAPGDYSVRTVTSNDSLTDADDLVLCDATNGDLTITLPPATTMAHKRFELKRMDASVNVVTIAPTSGTIDGNATITLDVQYEGVSLITSSTAWYLV